MRSALGQIYIIIRAHDSPANNGPSFSLEFLDVNWQDEMWMNKSNAVVYQCDISKHVIV